jgi:hypothetical protein
MAAHSISLRETRTASEDGTAPEPQSNTPGYKIECFQVILEGRDSIVIGDHKGQDTELKDTNDL